MNHVHINIMITDNYFLMVIILSFIASLLADLNFTHPIVSEFRLMMIVCFDNNN